MYVIFFFLAAHFAYELESLFLKNNIKIFPITNIVKVRIM